VKGREAGVHVTWLREFHECSPDADDGTMSC
jgi:hypothetical protein